MRKIFTSLWIGPVIGTGLFTLLFLLSDFARRTQFFNKTSEGQVLLYFIVFLFFSSCVHLFYAIQRTISGKKDRIILMVIGLGISAWLTFWYLVIAAFAW